MGATKIPDADFKTMDICRFKDLRGRMDDLSEKLNKKIVNIKDNIEAIKKNSHK